MSFPTTDAAGVGSRRSQVIEKSEMVSGLLCEKKLSGLQVPMEIV